MQLGYEKMYEDADGLVIATQTKQRLVLQSVEMTLIDAHAINIIMNGSLLLLASWLMLQF